MSIVVGVVFLCIVSGLTALLSKNPDLQRFAGYVFTASLAAIIIDGPRLLR